MKTYFDLINEARDILSRVESDTGEVSDEDLARITALEGDVGDRVQMVCRLIADENRIATAFQNEAAALSEAANRHDTRKEKLKDLLHELLNTLNIQNIRTDLYKVTVAKSPPRTRLREGVDISDLPAEYVRIVETPNLSKILSDYKQQTLPEDVAEKVVVEANNTHVRILLR